MGEARRPSAEDVVPIVEWRREQLDGGMKADHGLSHGLACGIEIEAAPEAAALLKEIGQPGGIGSGASGGQTAELWVEKVATDGVNGRFAEDDVGSRDGGKGEEAKIFTGTRGHAAPGNGTCAAEFCADGLAGEVAQQEDGVGSGVGVEVARVCQGVDQRLGQGALPDEVAPKGAELARRGRRQTQGRGRHSRERRGDGRWAALFEP